MWLMNYITKNSITAPKAEKGGVKSSGNTVSVDSSEEHREIKCCVPYGFASVVPVGESAVVLPLANGEVSLGVLAKNVELDEGEVMLSSKGGASIVLKNDGRVLINGKAVISLSALRAIRYCLRGVTQNSNRLCFAFRQNSADLSMTEISVQRCFCRTKHSRQSRLNCLPMNRLQK